MAAIRVLTGTPVARCDGVPNRRVSVPNRCEGRVDVRRGPGDCELCPRIAAEFCEMPGLRLTAAQAARVFNVEVGRCTEVLDVLVGEGMLLSSGEWIDADDLILARATTVTTDFKLPPKE
jgi:hypothetical protein